MHSCTPNVTSVAGTFKNLAYRRYIHGHLTDNVLYKVNNKNALEVISNVSSLRLYISDPHTDSDPGRLNYWYTAQPDDSTRILPAVMQ